MKKLLTILFISIMAVSCQKEAGLGVDDTLNPSGSNGSSSALRINALQNPILLKVQVGCSWVYEPMTVKVTHWDYVNGHTPMQIIDIDSFKVNTITPTFYTMREETGMTYTGAMQVDLIQDSLRLTTYTRYVMLTDSVGWTINLDTTQVSQQGWVGQNRIIDVVPKHYQ